MKYVSAVESDRVYNNSSKIFLCGLKFLYFVPVLPVVFIGATLTRTLATSFIHANRFGTLRPNKRPTRSGTMGGQRNFSIICVMAGWFCNKKHYCFFLFFTCSMHFCYLRQVTARARRYERSNLLDFANHPVVNVRVQNSEGGYACDISILTENKACGERRKHEFEIYPSNSHVLVRRKHAIDVEIIHKRPSPFKSARKIEPF